MVNSNNNNKNDGNSSKQWKIAGAVVVASVALLLVVGALVWYFMLPTHAPLAERGSTAIAIPFRLKKGTGESIGAAAIIIDKLASRINPELIGFVNDEGTRLKRGEINQREYYTSVAKTVVERDWDVKKVVKISDRIIGFVGATEPMECLIRRNRTRSHRFTTRLEENIGSCYGELYKQNPAAYDFGMSRAYVIGPKPSDFVQLIPCPPKAQRDMDPTSKCDLLYRWSDTPMKRDIVWLFSVSGVGKTEAEAVLQDIYTKPYTTRWEADFKDDIASAMEAAFLSQVGPHYMASRSYYGMILTERGDLIELDVDFPLPQDATTTTTPRPSPVVTLNTIIEVQQ